MGDFNLNLPKFPVNMPEKFDDKKVDLAKLLDKPMGDFNLNLPKFPVNMPEKFDNKKVDLAKLLDKPMKGLPKSQ